MSASDVRGGCLCGAIRFETRGPFPFCVHCHCAWCRRAHGSAFVTWLGARSDAFAIVSGQPRWYSSSEQSKRGFCGDCGTTLFFASTLASGEMHIARACVDADCAAVPEPTAHIFYEARVPWFEPKDDLPKVDRDHGGLQKYQVIARSPEESG